MRTSLGRLPKIVSDADDRAAFAAETKRDVSAPPRVSASKGFTICGNSSAVLYVTFRPRRVDRPAICSSPERTARRAEHCPLAVLLSQTCSANRGLK